MKNKSIYIIFLAISFINACTKEDSPTPSGGASDDRDRFTGTWVCTENGSTTFTINITKNGVADTIKIENFGGYGSTAPQTMALISGNSMTIPSQAITVTLINVQGSAVMNSAGTKITMNYMADGASNSATCVR